MTALLWMAVLPASASDIDAGWILRQLVQPVPSQTPFIELRGSALLKEPLRVSGQYRRPDAGTLVRAVQQPYRETTTIAGDQVTIEREGKPARRFALSRAPELADVQTSFGALLGGDQALLQQHYRLSASGTPARWSLTLTPIAPALAKRVAGVVLHGQQQALTCIETRLQRGEPQRTLLGPAAMAGEGVRDAAQLAALCRGPGA